MDVLGSILAVIVGIGLLWLFFEFPGFIILLIFVIVGVGMCTKGSETTVNDVVESITDSVSNESTEPTIEDSLDEQCIDGIVYLFVTKDGKNFMHPKEDTFGYNVKCSE
jgi:hypothetical protein